MRKFRQLILTASDFFDHAATKKGIGIPYLQISITCLLLRQSIELLIFSSLIIHKDKYKLIKKCKQWRIEQDINGIEELNKDWMPEAINITKKIEMMKTWKN